MNPITTTAISGINAAMLGLGTSANNVANAQTAGFRRQSVVQQAQAGGGVSSTVNTSAVAGDDLATDTLQQMSSLYAFKADLRVVQTQGRMLGQLVDLKA